MIEEISGLEELQGESIEDEVSQVLDQDEDIDDYRKLLNSTIENISLNALKYELEASNTIVELTVLYEETSSSFIFENYEIEKR